MRPTLRPSPRRESVRPAALAARVAALAAATVLTTAVPAFAASACERTAQHARADDARTFGAALARFRAGDESARTALFEAAHALEASGGRGGALRIASFYGALGPEERAQGWALEAEFDERLAAIAEIDARAESAERERSVATAAEDLEAWLGAARRTRDPAPAAYGLSLLARLEVRALESERAPAASDLAAPARNAAEAIERFERAGFRTPQLEPRWVLARLALAEGRVDLAEARYRALEALAREVDRPVWRERALLGLIDIARRRGDPFEAGAALRALASFRSPDTSWSLAREVAVQKLTEDDVARATLWLGSHPPSELDEELAGDAALAEARDEWRALVLAARLRAGLASDAPLDRRHGLEPTAATVGQGAPLEANESTREVLFLAGVALAIESGDADEALRVLREREVAAGSELGRVEALTLEGRALMTLGRAQEALAPLERALELTRERERAEALGTGAAPTASRIGEWLGLTTVEWLARAYAETGDPLRAAGLIESVHAGGAVEGACARLVAIAAGTDLGVVTWVVGADASLAVHVRPDGTASHHRIARGRRAIDKATRRLRAALARAPRQGMTDADPEFESLAEEVSRALLPASLIERVAASGGRGAAGDGAGPTLVLLPHGALERLPLEALPVPDGEAGARLGLLVALTIGDRLATERDAGAPEFVAGRTRWRALGAPVDTPWPDLDAAAAELAALEHLHPRVEVAAATAFTRAALVDALESGDALHLATHAVRTPDGRSASPIAIATSGGDCLSWDDVATIRPALPLAILATCESGDGRSIEGRGVLGLGQALLDGGTRAVIVTLWPVDDGTAYRASTLLHGALAAGHPPAEALRRARAALARSGAPIGEWSAYRAMRRP